VSNLASLVAQPMAVARTAVETVGAGDATPSGAAGATSAQFAGDYAMSLLAKITHASADQALALIQTISTPVPPLR
jgi:sugar/nucleoside kinase (ribokinase family)